MRRAARVDETQAEIVSSLRECHVQVWPIGQPCDLLCKRGSALYLLDCDGITEYRKRHPDQLKKFAEWGVTIVATPEEAIRAVGL